MLHSKNRILIDNEDKIPSDLFKTITTYLKGRQHFTGEKIEMGSLKISTITLSIYASKDFCKKIDGKTIFQIGEEAFACPFYRSFNDNASCIPSFSKAMKALFENNNVEPDKMTSSSFFGSSFAEKNPLEFYQQKVQRLVNSEIRTIHFFNYGIEMIETSAASTRFVPQISGSKLLLKSGGKTFLNEVNGKNQVDDEAENNSSSSNCILF